MEVGILENNVIQEKSYKLALNIVNLVKKFPRRTEGFVLGNQLLKAGTSVGANVEEAIGAFSREDFIYRMNIAQKESRETHYWLRLIRDSKLLIDEELNVLINDAEEVMRILGAIVRSSRKN